MKLSEKDQKILDFFVNIMDKEDNEILLADLEKKNPPYPILDLESSAEKLEVFNFLIIKNYKKRSFGACQYFITKIGEEASRDQLIIKELKEEEKRTRKKEALDRTSTLKNRLWIIRFCISTGIGLIGWILFFLKIL